MDLVDFEGVNYNAFYRNFQVEEEPLYRLRISDFDEEMSTLEDSLKIHDGMAFSTSDKDNDEHSTNCAVVYHGAWWYKGCYRSSLNGLNYNNGSLPELKPEYYGKGIVWWNNHNVPDHDAYFSWPDTSMKIRRKL